MTENPLITPGERAERKKFIQLGVTAIEKYAVLVHPVSQDGQSASPFYTGVQQSSVSLEGSAVERAEMDEGVRRIEILRKQPYGEIYPLGNVYVGFEFDGETYTYAELMDVGTEFQLDYTVHGSPDALWLATDYVALSGEGPVVVKITAWK